MAISMSASLDVHKEFNDRAKSVKVILTTPDNKIQNDHACNVIIEDALGITISVPFFIQLGDKGDDIGHKLNVIGLYPDESSESCMIRVDDAEFSWNDLKRRPSSIRNAILRLYTRTDTVQTDNKLMLLGNGFSDAMNLIKDVSKHMNYSLRRAMLDLAALNQEGSVINFMDGLVMAQDLAIIDDPRSTKGKIHILTYGIDCSSAGNSCECIIGTDDPAAEVMTVVDNEVGFGFENFIPWNNDMRDLVNRMIKSKIAVFK